MAERLVLTGRVATFDDERRVMRRGAVYLADGRVEAVRSSGASAPAGFAGAPRVATGGLIVPGLIDLHNHLAYNFLPLWKAPRTTPYETRYQWPGAATYGRDISNPAQAMAIAAPAATLRYAEVKAVVGGVTAVQGSPPLNRPFPGWMVRNVEKERFADTPGQLVYQAVLQATPAQLAKYAERLDAGASFIYHLAEGTSDMLRAEFRQLATANCVQQGLVGIHSTALDEADFADWAPRAGAVVWSPFSNLWLYGDTTDVLAARRHGLTVCLGADWAPSGSKNLLGELKVASLWNDTALAGELDPLELCELVTRNPGETLERAWGRPVGRLVEGALADVAVLAPRADDAYESMLAASERHVRLVLVGGRPVYGSASLLAAAGARRAEPITVAGVRRAVCMALPEELQPDEPDLRAAANMGWAEGLARLRAVVADPAGEVRKARQQKAIGVEPLELVPDMPGPGGDVGARELTDDELDQLVMPPIETLAHDRAWFGAVDDAHPHAAVLRQLRGRFG